MNAGTGKCEVGSVASASRCLRLMCGIVLFAGMSLPARAGLFDDEPSGSKPPPKTTAPAKPAESAPASEPEKLPLPTDAQRRAALKQVRDAMKDDLAKAKTAEAKTQLAGQMLQTADGTTDAAGRYVLLREAENLAADAADVDTALSADDAVNKAFGPDATAAAIDPLQKFMREPLAADASARVCEAALGVLHTALALNRFDAARQAGRVAVAMARKANNRELTERATGVLSSVNAIEADYARVVPAEAVLKKAPGDPAANATVGRYECFFKGDWAAGLPKLAKGNNDALKKAASNELKAPKTAQERSAVADAWWAVADAQPPALQPAIRAHAATCYAQALDGGLSGLAKLKAEERIARAKPSESKSTVATGRPSNSATPVTPVSNHDTSPPAESAEIRGPFDIIHAIPADMYPKTLSEWTNERQAAVNQELSKAISGKKGTFQAVVQEIYPASGRVLTRSVLVGKISFHMTLHFDADARGPLASLRVGMPCTVTGELHFPRFTGMELVVTLDHCQFVR